MLLIGLFVVNAAFAATGVPQKTIPNLASAGIDLTHPLTLLGVVATMSNVVGHNPVVMLVAPVLTHGADPHVLSAALALAAGFASNLMIFGSISGIIVVEQAAAHGLRIGSAEFSRAGAPVALLCLAMTAVWIGVILPQAGWTETQ